MNPIIDKIQLNNLLKEGYFSFIAATLTVIVLPIHVQFLPPFMILWGVFWLIEKMFNAENKSDITTINKLFFLLFIIYYLWQVIGLLYSDDLRMGYSNLFGRLSLLLFPLVLTFPGYAIRKKAKYLMKIFAVSTFIFILFCFFFALLRSLNYQEGGWTFNPHLPGFPWLNYFYGSSLTLSQHPSYIAMYVLLATFISFESWFDYSLKFKHRILWLLLGFLLIISQYFLSSRAGILISLVLVPLYFTRKFYILGKRRFAWIWIILVIIVLVPVIAKNQRVDYLYGSFIHKKDDYERKEDPRFLIWKSALKIARQNLLIGVGIGDVRTSLASEYEMIGEEKMAKERFNAHNQFLEILLENGIIGLVLFISIFAVMSYIAISDKNLLYGVFIFMIFMFFMFETVLYRLAGVTFFSLFSFLLLHVPENKNIR
ncbi:MAG TPA: O-antigen ligase family protein [Bacteroidales bacterium]|nr:O-antigen ligase family protein [Bacteroidales bacterium]